MALDWQSSYIQKAHRLSLYDVSASVTTVEAGQLFQLDDNGEWVYADGTRRAYPTLNQRIPGEGIGSQGERLEGRDDVSRAGKLSVLTGNYEIATDQFDPDAAFAFGAALHPSTEAGKEGLLTTFDSGNAAHAVENIRGYVTVVPNEEHEFLRYQG